MVRAGGQDPTGRKQSSEVTANSSLGESSRALMGLTDSGEGNSMYGAAQSREMDVYVGGFWDPIKINPVVTSSMCSA